MVVTKAGRLLACMAFMNVAKLESLNHTLRRYTKLEGAGRDLQPVWFMRKTLITDSATTPAHGWGEKQAVWQGCSGDQDSLARASCSRDPGAWQQESAWAKVPKCLKTVYSPGTEVDLLGIAVL